MQPRRVNMVKWALSCTAVLLASACYDRAAAPMAKCQVGLRPISPLVAPKLPIGESIPFMGAAQVRFVIDRRGNVHAPIIVSDAVRPVGRRHGKVEAHHEAIIATVMALRYPARSQPCWMDAPFEIKLGEEAA